AQECAKVVPVAVLELGTLHLGSVILRMTVVVLKHTKNVGQPCPGDKHQADPMVNQSTRAGNHRAGVASLELADQDLASTERGVPGGSTLWIKGIDPQQPGALLPLAFLARFCPSDVTVKSFHRGGFQVDRLRRGCCRRTGGALQDTSHKS